MRDQLMEELRILAQKLLDATDASEINGLKEHCREIYEKLVVAEDREKHEIISEVHDPAARSIEDVADERDMPIEAETSEPTESVESPESAEENPEEYPRLQDLFVPTFDDIKEDMSQKEEFRDTVSLDETEKLFETKKEESKQLSLNDKLVGSSIQVGLNDRIAFVNKLFNFSQSDFNRVLSRLNTFQSKKEALDYFQYQVKPNYNWKGKEDLEERFVLMIERKFMS